MQKAIRLAAIGYGNRMRKYLKYTASHPDDVELCSVVEINDALLQNARQSYHLTAEQCFSSTDDFFREKRDIDAVLICTPDDTHFELAEKAIGKGYHILLEKPLSGTFEQCRQLTEAAAEKGVLVLLCYVLRYHPYYKKIKEILNEGWLGPIISINYVVNVGLDRATHSFVRGPWGNEKKTSPMLLSKCCHDMDLICWLTGSAAKAVTSYGSRRWFRSENAPAGSSLRCCDCRIEATCPYSAIDLYKRRRAWISNFIVPEGKTLDEIIDEEISGGEFGRCVYHCSNDVVDNQIVSMQMTDGTIVSLSMDCFTTESNRSIDIKCAYGEIHAANDKILVTDFCKKTKREYDFSEQNARPFHAGADFDIVEDFVNSIRHRPGKDTPIIGKTLESHRICFLAEESRRSGE